MDNWNSLGFNQPATVCFRGVDKGAFSVNPNLSHGFSRSTSFPSISQPPTWKLPPSPSIIVVRKTGTYSQMQVLKLPTQQSRPNEVNNDRHTVQNTEQSTTWKTVGLVRWWWTRPVWKQDILSGAFHLVGNGQTVFMELHITQSLLGVVIPTTGNQSSRSRNSILIGELQSRSSSLLSWCLLFHIMKVFTHSYTYTWTRRIADNNRLFPRRVIFWSFTPIA